MSYHYYSIDGYGFCVDDFYLDITPEKIKKMLDFPEYSKLKESVQKYFDEENITEPTVEDYENFAEYETENHHLAGLIYLAMQEVKPNHPITLCNDFDDRYYILYEPTYSWGGNNKDNSFLLKEDCTDFFMKYIKMFTDKAVSICYQSVENGG